MTRWPDLLRALLAGQTLPPAQVEWAMREILDGAASPAQVAGFVVALRAKGETDAEVGALARVMLELAEPLAVPPGVRTVDTCGTGGAGQSTVNISTMAACVVAGTGAQVIKHGGRSASSSSGSADVLEALGVAIELSPAGVATCLESGAPVFCFAPVFHPSFRHAAVPRRELGVPTVFNVLGPLTNPGRPSAQLVGVAEARLAAVMARVLAGRGVDALVVHGDDGLDELSTATTSRTWWVRAGAVHEEAVDPRRHGLLAGDLVGGDPDHNADVCRRVLAGERGAVRDAVLFNAAAALVVYAPGEGDLAGQLDAGLRRAAESVDSGAAEAALQRWVTASQAARG